MPLSSSVLFLLTIFGFFLLVQFIFWIGYFRKLAFAPTETTSHDPKKLPPVSVVCCAHNETANLQKLIPALIAQNYPCFEIIVVDDRSDDEMYDYLLYLKTQEKLVRLVRIEHVPDGMNYKKFSLTMGIKAAKYENILLTDADCFPASNNWITTMAAQFTPAKEIVLGYSLYRPHSGLLNALIRYETFITCLQYLSMAMSGHPYMGVGRNLAYTKGIFLRNKGFTEHINVTGGDDDLFINRVATAQNTAVCLQPEALMFSEPKRTFAQWYKQKLRHLGVGGRYLWRDKWWLALLSASQTGVWIAGIMVCFLPEPFCWFGLGGLALRTNVQTVILYKSTQRLGETLPWYSFLFLDILQVLYPPLFALPALLFPRRSWN